MSQISLMNPGTEGRCYKDTKDTKMQHRSESNGMSMPMNYFTQLLQCTSAKERVWRIGHTKYLLFKHIHSRAFYKDMNMHLKVFMGQDCVMHLGSGLFTLLLN